MEKGKKYYFIDPKLRWVEIYKVNKIKHDIVYVTILFTWDIINRLPGPTEQELSKSVAFIKDSKPFNSYNLIQDIFNRNI